MMSRLVAILVTALLYGCSPPAVGGFVSSMAIGESVERGAWRSLPHIGKESPKVVPAWVDANTCTAIAGPVPTFGVETSIAHGLPAGVRAARMHSAVPMGHHGCSRPFTTARGTSTSPQVVSVNCLQSSAPALAKPHTWVADSFAPEYFPTPELSAAQVNVFSHTGSVTRARTVCMYDSRFARATDARCLGARSCSFPNQQPVPRGRSLLASRYTSSLF